jgi:hypothetical protein
MCALHGPFRFSVWSKRGIKVVNKLLSASKENKEHQYKSPDIDSTANRNWSEMSSLTRLYMNQI